jgi:hypothetical protein
MDGREWSASRPGHFTPWEELLVPIGYESGWAPKPVWMLWHRKISYLCQDSNLGLPTLILATLMTAVLVPYLVVKRFYYIYWHYFCMKGLLSHLRFDVLCGNGYEELSLGIWCHVVSEKPPAFSFRLQDEGSNSVPTYQTMWYYFPEAILILTLLLQLLIRILIVCFILGCDYS